MRPCRPLRAAGSRWIFFRAPLALLLFTSARTPARSGAEGHVVTLANQDRDRWNPEPRSQCGRISVVAKSCQLVGW
ncbi:MAG: DUF6596 domain-containing protein [Streptosporangiaceae bacterium]